MGLPRRVSCRGYRLVRRPIANKVWATAPHLCGVKFFETGSRTVPITTVGSDVRVLSIASLYLQSELGLGAQFEHVRMRACAREAKCLAAVPSALLRHRHDERAGGGAGHIQMGGRGLLPRAWAQRCSPGGWAGE